MFSPEEIEERVRAVGSQSSLIFTEFPVQKDVWKLYSPTQKRLALAAFGLKNAIPISLFDEVPDWSLPTKISSDALNDAVQNLKVHISQLSSSIFFLVSVKNHYE
ncbi:unnamed protein product [Auanema sp. JU1783]|nr:unnamed protein product [Auanema sp. JU1783]